MSNMTLTSEYVKQNRGGTIRSLGTYIYSELMNGPYPPYEFHYNSDQCKNNLYDYTLKTFQSLTVRWNSIALLEELYFEQINNDRQNAGLSKFLDGVGIIEIGNQIGYMVSVNLPINVYAIIVSLVWPPGYVYNSTCPYPISVNGDRLSVHDAIVHAIGTNVLTGKGNSSWIHNGKLGLFCNCGQLLDPQGSGKLENGCWLYKNWRCK